MIIALCAACHLLMPNTVKTEIEHVSSIEQHFEHTPTNFGADMATVVAHWDIPYHAYVELGQGYCIDGCTAALHHSITQIRVGFQWQLK